MMYKRSAGHNNSYSAAEGLLFSKKKQEEVLEEMRVKEGFEKG